VSRPHVFVPRLGGVLDCAHCDAPKAHPIHTSSVVEPGHETNQGRQPTAAKPFPLGTVAPALPSGSAERKAIPLARGLLDYFPAALAAVAALSKAGNDKHNPGQPLHHSRGKSSDHADCIVRHLIDRGTVDTEDGIRHSVKVAWRALALLQEELEAAGEASLPRGAWTDSVNGSK
jgi:hypothetical protein